MADQAFKDFVTGLAAAGALAGSEVLPIIQGGVTKKIPSATLVPGATLATPQASTSGTAIDFTSIPSGAKKITVMFNGVSTSGSSNVQIQIGDSGGVETSGYFSGAFGVNASAFGGGVTSASGFLLYQTAAAVVAYGSVTLSLMDSTNNTWTANGSFVKDDTIDSGYFCSGAKSLSATLDRVRITTENGTDTFDAGTINIQWV